MRRPHLLSPLAWAAVVAVVLAGCVPSDPDAIDVEIPAISSADFPEYDGSYGSPVLDVFDDLVVLLPAVELLRQPLADADAEWGAAVVPGAGAAAVETAGGGSGTAPALGRAATSDDDAVGNGSWLAGSAFVGLIGSINDADGVVAAQPGDIVGEAGSDFTVVKGENNAQVTATQTTTKTDGDISVTSEFGAAIEGKVCPDADGRFDFTAKVRVVQTGTSPSESATASQEMTVHITGSLDDSAQPSSIKVEGEQQITEAGESGDPVTVASSQSYEGGTEAIFGFPMAVPSLVSKSSGATSADVERLSKRGGIRMNGLGFGALTGAMSIWSNGGCVKIVAPAPSVKPDESVSIPVSTVQKATGEKFAAPVDLALSGAKKIDKQKLTTESAVTYTAGKAGEAGTLTLTTKSRRGGATLTLQLGAKGQAYSAIGGGGDFSGSGTICDITKPFTISGGGVVMSFTPSSAAAGTYSYSGSLMGFGVSGSGTYTVAYAGELATAIEASGPGSVEGAGSANGTENYRLTPTTSGC